MAQMGNGPNEQWPMVNCKGNDNGTDNAAHNDNDNDKEDENENDTDKDNDNNTYIDMGNDTDKDWVNDNKFMK